MAYMFSEAKVFNWDVSKWDTAKAIMVSMFNQATVFNGDVTKWDTASVTEAYLMFKNASSFDRDLSDWDTKKMVDKQGSDFSGCYDFATDSGCEQSRPHPKFETCGAKFDNCTPCRVRDPDDDMADPSEYAAD